MRSFNASTAADLQPVALVLADLKYRADECAVEIMVVGATARDILIRHVVGSVPERATADIDVAVAVASWSHLDELTRPFTRQAGSEHKFEVRETEVDVIPFGEIEDTHRTITWPNDHRMNVFGFREAMSTAVHVTFPGDLVVAVASLPAQSLLKLFAWQDRHYDDRRDAIDLRSILLAYHEGPYLDELYARHARLIERHDFDPRLAGAHRIGSDARALIAPDNVGHVTDLLDDPQHFDLLGADMGGPVRENRSLLTAYREGFTEPAKQ
jgi:predicted nucleotidyltransferase